VPERLEQTVMRMIEVFNSEGIDAALEYIDPEIQWVAPPEWLEDRLYAGRDELRRLAEFWMSQFDDYRLDPAEFIDLGDDRGVLLIHQRGRIRSSNDTIEQPVGWVVQVRDGRLARVDVFFSWEATREAAGLAN
jgi:ketosteroid isomerase-like protein